MFITAHARERVTARLFGIVTLPEVVKAIEGSRPCKCGEFHILVKTLRGQVTITEDNGLRLMGDQVWAVVRKASPQDCGALVTVMLRCSAQPKRGSNVS